MNDALHGFGILDGDLALMAGWIATESSWDPFAIRYEPGFYSKYIIPLGLKSQTEARARAMSWGLLQIMGEVAREFGFKGKYLARLCDPRVNLDLAATILKNRHNRIGSWRGALASYNGGLGGNTSPPFRNDFYVEKVLERAKDYGHNGELE